MKNKKTLYLLIPLAIAIWGNIFYKIYTAMHGDEEVPVSLPNHLPSETTTELNDTFSIYPDYRDPFFGTMQRKNKSTVSSANSVSNSSIKPGINGNTSIQLNFPKIVYGGLIKNENSKKQLALLLINGNSYTLKIGEQAEHVQLINLFKDSIEVKYNNLRKYISK